MSVTDRAAASEPAGPATREWDWCVLGDDRAAHLWAASQLAEKLGEAVASRGRASLGLSGGATGRAIIEVLAVMDVAWEQVDVFQVDERMVGAENPARHAPWMEAALRGRARWHPMPVELADADPAAAIEAYSGELATVAGEPPCLDVVHLGLGADGHSASLFPGSPELTSMASCCVTADTPSGWRRMTLSLPTLASARDVVLGVTGADKAAAVARLALGDTDVPATHLLGRVTLVLDDPATAALPDRG